MSGDRYEPNRFLGFPVRAEPRGDSRAGPGSGSGGEQRPRQGEEPQRVMGFPVDWLGPGDGPGSLAEPVRKGWRWLRRRLGGQA
jgi:hypothetical protein